MLSERSGSHNGRVLSRGRAAVYRRVMRARPGPVGAALLALGLTCLLAPPALAQATCTYVPGTKTVEVALVAGEAATISRSGDAIALDGAPCGAATVDNTDTIEVTGSGGEDDLTIDLAGGAFAPGATPEGGGGEDEIEFAVDLPGGGVVRVAGGAGADTLALGTLGANLNADEAAGDADVVLAGPASWEILGRQGADVLRVAGGSGTGAALAGVTVRAGTGDDLVVAGGGGATLDGQGGTDTVSYAGAEGVRADLAAGTARPEGAAKDDLAGLEHLVGSPGPDVLRGDDGDNRIEGGKGRDVLDGGKGDDVLKGGEARDTVDLRHAREGVSVNLRTGTATGLGEDTLVGIEDVTGTDRRDTLVGSEGANALRGRGGPDVLRGGAGRDLLVGGLGGDVLQGGLDGDRLEGGKGKDQLHGGDGRDTCAPGPDPDAWTSCEVLEL